MNKVLVTIKVLRLNEEFEVFLPVNKKIVDIICMLVKSLNEFTNGVFPLTYNNLLYDIDQNVFYDPSLSLKDAGINNGKKLILI